MQGDHMAVGIEIKSRHARCPAFAAPTFVVSTP
jgi:hypothetical protein